MTPGPGHRWRGTLGFDRRQRRAATARRFPAGARPGAEPAAGPRAPAAVGCLGLSVLAHLLLLCLTFGGDGLGLPGFGFPWQERRVEVPDLRIVLVPGEVKAAPPGRCVGSVPVGAGVGRSAGGRRAGSAAARIHDASAAARPGCERARGHAIGRNGASVRGQGGTVALSDPAPLDWAQRPETSADIVPASTPQPAVLAMAPPDAAAWVVRWRHRRRCLRRPHLLAHHPRRIRSPAPTWPMMRAGPRRPRGG